MDLFGLSIAVDDAARHALNELAFWEPRTSNLPCYTRKELEGSASHSQENVVYIEATVSDLTELISVQALAKLALRL